MSEVLTRHERSCVARLKRRAAHLEERIAKAPNRTGVSYDKSELSALRTMFRVLEDLEPAD